MKYGIQAVMVLPRIGSCESKHKIGFEKCGFKSIIHRSYLKVVFSEQFGSVLYVGTGNLEINDYRGEFWTSDYTGKIIIFIIIYGA